MVAARAAIHHVGRECERRAGEADQRGGSKLRRGQRDRLANGSERADKGVAELRQRLDVFHRADGASENRADARLDRDIDPGERRGITMSLK